MLIWNLQSGILQKLVAHRDTLQDVMTRICELVQRDAFTQSVHSLGLLDLGNISTHSSDCKIDRNSSTPKQNTGIKVIYFDDICCLTKTIVKSHWRSKLKQTNFNHSCPLVPPTSQF